jgi:hypothetical protein
LDAKPAKVQEVKQVESTKEESLHRDIIEEILSANGEEFDRLIREYGWEVLVKRTNGKKRRTYVRPFPSKISYNSRIKAQEGFRGFVRARV